ncbi:ECF RNA polymerase sigma factor SigL [Arthrobacter sp. SO5]|uniref:RNA polymerase sigma factor n=1 Tax=Arthrobacter sp. SO5 TaxID=1897055 RepID=UPI001E379DDB|nr:RNA polymerase sigma factor [Arthrobacter sp. SO5]MCB5273745.1 ECF RNA polymerase sigma factor SigL [Arthrobacter sp. SO5]
MGEESDISDGVLWCRVVSGDGDAFGAVFDRHHGRVLSHALRVLGVPHQADDVTAVVFYEAWRCRIRVRIVNDSVLPWLLVTTNNTIRNHSRQQQRYRHFLSQLPSPEAAPDVAEDVVDAAQRMSESSVIRRAFAQLRPLDRDILTLCVIEGLSTKVAGTTLGIADGTVKSRLHRAKSRLGILFSEVSREHAPGNQVMHGWRTQ